MGVCVRVCVVCKQSSAPYITPHGIKSSVCVCVSVSVCVYECVCIPISLIIFSEKFGISLCTRYLTAHPIHR